MSKKLASSLLAALAIVASAACGSAGQAAPSPSAEVTPVEAQATEATVATTAPTSTPEPLSAGEIQDEETYLETVVSFADLPASMTHFSKIQYTKIETGGPFEVVVTKAGPFTLTRPDSGDERYFRVELRITNVGSEKEVFAPDAIVLSDGDGNRYELQPEASKRTLGYPVEVAPETLERGYLLFQPLPPDTGVVKLSFEQGSDESGSPHQFEYELELSDE